MTNTTTARTTRRRHLTAHRRRAVAVLIAGLITTMALPGTAHAFTPPPDGVDTSTAPALAPAINQAAATQTSTSGWALATVFAVIAVAAVALVVAATVRRVMRRHRVTQATIARA